MSSGGVIMSVMQESAAGLQQMGVPSVRMPATRLPVQIGSPAGTPPP